MPVITPKRQTGISNIDGFVTRNGYTPSSPYQNSDDDMPTPLCSVSIRLRASIASTPQAKLREVLIRLVDHNPDFQLAVAQELLACTPEHPSPSPRRKRRRSGRRSFDVKSTDHCCGKCGKSMSDDSEAEKCHYHPGTLQCEIYEFPSRTPDGQPFDVTRTIYMWSCCDEDTGSPGCATAKAHVRRRRVASENRARSRVKNQENDSDFP